ncbi:MAG: response regulator transcription factor [Pseudomonadota bacterium]
MGCSNPNKYQILLVDDHPLIRRVIRGIIEESPELEVVGELNDGQEFIEFLDQCAPHPVILDLSMPRVGGIAATQKVKASHPQVKVLILTMHKNQEYLDQARLAGAEGYLLKEEMDRELLPAIAALRHGRTFVSHFLSRV